MALTFKSSEEHTLGIEIEIQLVDKDSFALVPESPRIIGALERHEGFIKHELMLSNLEVNTSVCRSVEEAANELYEKISYVSDVASRFNTLLCCAGSHPFSHWKDQVIKKESRYDRLVESLRIVARRFNIFGFHVHIGVSSGEKCIYVMNKILYYLPHLLALSANSPFWNGENTGLKSYRSKVFETLPTAGLPFYFEGWQDYSKLVDNYIATGTIETIREIWWDVRPHPDFGTLEIRLCDAPITVEETVAIAGLVQAMVARFGREFDEGLPLDSPHSSVIRENKWRATRYGLDGMFLTPEGNETVKVRDAIFELLSQLEEEKQMLSLHSAFATVEDIMKNGEGALKQLVEWKKSDDIKDVVGYLTGRLSSEIASWQGGRE